MKNKATFTIILALAILCGFVIAKNAHLMDIEKSKKINIVVKGKVIDYDTKNPIVRAKILYKEWTDKQYQIGSQTLKYGTYRFKIPTGHYYKFKAQKQPFYADESTERNLKNETLKKEIEIDFEMTYVGRLAYKLGAILSLSGYAGFIGMQQKNTLSLIKEEINAKGGIRGRKIEIIFADDKSCPDESRVLLEKLIMHDRVLAVIGPSINQTSISLGADVAKYRTILISLGSTPSITLSKDSGKQREWVFKVSPSNSLAMQRIFEYLYEKRMKRVALLSASPQDRELIKTLAPKYEVQIIADEQYMPFDIDLTSQLVKIKARNPQAIINWSYGRTQQIVSMLWLKLGMSNIPLFQNQWFASGYKIEKLGSEVSGIYSPRIKAIIAEHLPPDDPQGQIALGYYRSYKKRYGMPVTAFGANAWDAIQLVIDAIKFASPSKKRIRAHIENKKGFVGQSGIFNFSPADHAGLTSDAFAMAVVKRGKWVGAK